MTGWIVVVPVKGALGAKTRLGADLDDAQRGEFALAFATDTISAVLASAAVERVVVVTNAPELAWLDHDPRVSVVAEGEPRGLNAAIGAGIAHARALSGTTGVAVVLGDLPALRAEELTGALAAAAEHRSATVPDADGTGTTVLTAAPGVDPVPAFGLGSAAAHRDAGAFVLDLPVSSTVRHDVDTALALAAAIALGVGPATAALLAALAPLG